MADRSSPASRTEKLREALHLFLDLLADRVAERLIQEHKRRNQRADFADSAPSQSSMMRRIPGKRSGTKNGR